MELYPVFWELFIILGVFGGRPKYPWKNIGNTVSWETGKLGFNTGRNRGS